MVLSIWVGDTMLNDGHTSARGWIGARIRKLAGPRSALWVAMLAVLFAAISSPSYAETGSVRFKFFKAGWFVGAQTGSGILEFRDQIYPFHVGGLSAGLTFGGSSTDFVGTARNMHQPTDIEGVYTAVGAGGAVGRGARGFSIRTPKRGGLAPQGQNPPRLFDFDLSGMNVSIQKQ